MFEVLNTEHRSHAYEFSYRRPVPGGRVLVNRDCSAIADCRIWRVPIRGGSSGDLLPPSPPAENATTRQDQAGQASADDGAGDWVRLSINEVIHNDQVQTWDFGRPRSYIAICYSGTADFE